MKTIPRKKMGIEVPIRAELVIVTSRNEYLFLAERTPMGIAIAREKKSPNNWISKVAQVR